jgi:hypothetical protein
LVVEQVAERIYEREAAIGPALLELALTVLLARGQGRLSV